MVTLTALTNLAKQFKINLNMELVTPGIGLIFWTSIVFLF